jgi:hypothetical protein
MKKISISILTFVLAVLLMSSAAHAAMSANVSYNETDLGSGLWQYDFTIENTSLLSDTHPYLWDLTLDFEEYANVTILNQPLNWTIGSYTSSFDLNDTDYLEMYSDATAYDVIPGDLVSLSFIADYQLGGIDFKAIFSDHGTQENWETVSGTASPVPIPAAVLLFGSGLIGLMGIRHKMGR